MQPDYRTKTYASLHPLMEAHLTPMTQDTPLAWRYAWITPELVPDLVSKVRLSGGCSTRLAATRFLFGALARAPRKSVPPLRLIYWLLITVARFFT